MVVFKLCMFQSQWRYTIVLETDNDVLGSKMFWKDLQCLIARYRHLEKIPNNLLTLKKMNVTYISI